MCVCVSLLTVVLGQESIRPAVVDFQLTSARESSEFIALIREGSMFDPLPSDQGYGWERGSQGIILGNFTYQHFFQHFLKLMCCSVNTPFHLKTSFVSKP